MNSTGVDRIEGPRLPVSHLGQDPVGDVRDHVPRHLRPIDLGQVRGHLPGRETLRGERQHQLVDAGQAALTFLRTILGSKVPSRSRGTSMSTGPTSVTTILDRFPFREFDVARPAGSFVA
jgi:hypothetical protein